MASTPRSSRLRAALVAIVALGGIAFAGVGLGSSAASAAVTSNFVATGHDMDYHCYSGDSDSCAYFKIVLNKVRNGSTLPVLALDEGSQIEAGLSGSGIPVVTVDPSDATTFNATPFVSGGGAPLYSAIVTASDANCGGCDNSATGSANINARKADIKTFFNAGGGILALAGAGRAGYYDFVPFPDVTAIAVAGPFTVLPAGTGLGVTDAMANCCATHNSFDPPASPFVQLEKDSADKAETIGAFDVVIGGGGFETTTAPGTGTSSPFTVIVTTTSTSTTTTSTSTTTTTEPETTTTAEETTTTEAPVTVAPTVPPTTSGGVLGTSGSTGGGGLARTGAPLGQFTLMGVALVAFGAAILIARKKLWNRA